MLRQINQIAKHGASIAWKRRGWKSIDPAAVSFDSDTLPRGKAFHRYKYRKSAKTKNGGLHLHWRLTMNTVLRKTRACFFLLGLGLLLSGTARANLVATGLGLDDPANRSLNIFGNGGLLGSLAIDNYYSWTSGFNSGGGIPYTPQNPGLSTVGSQYQNAGGLHMSSTFSFAPSASAQLRWINTIVSGVSTIGPAPYLDPYNRDDGLPFYWTESENAGVGASGTFFRDRPMQSRNSIGASVHFETAFVSVNMATKQVHWLAGFDWGYGMTASGPAADTFVWLTSPSRTLSNLVTAWDGGASGGFLGNGVADGWTWSSDCMCTAQPVPIPGVAYLFGMIAVVVVRHRRGSPLAGWMTRGQSL
jgi:hypothetical protein